MAEYIGYIEDSLCSSCFALFACSDVTWFHCSMYCNYLESCITALEMGY